MNVGDKVLLKKFDTVVIENHCSPIEGIKFIYGTIVTVVRIIENGRAFKVKECKDTLLDHEVESVIKID